MADSAPTTDDDKEQDQGDEQENYVDFPMPEGFEPPKGTKPGDEFEALATLKIDDDGDLCLLKLDGADVKPEDEEEEDNDNNKGEQSALESMRQNLPSTGLPAGTQL
jgi:hypothetical protein